MPAFAMHTWSTLEQNTNETQLRAQSQLRDGYPQYTPLNNRSLARWKPIKSSSVLLSIHRAAMTLTMLESIQIGLWLSAAVGSGRMSAFCESGRKANT